MSKRLPSLGLVALAACAQPVPVTSVRVTEPVKDSMGHYHGVIENHSNATVQRVEFKTQFTAPDGVVVEEQDYTLPASVPPGQRREYDFSMNPHSGTEWETARQTWAITGIAGR